MRKLLMFFLIMLHSIVITSTARSKEYNWSNYQEPYKIKVNVALFKGSSVYVHLPADYVQNNDFIKLHVDVQSNFTYTIDGLAQKGFEGFSPKISINGGIIRGNYHIPVKATPVRQTATVKIRTNYLKAGKNRLKFYVGKEDAINYRCKTGRSCIGFFVHEIFFDDFKSTKKTTGSQSAMKKKQPESTSVQEKESMVWSFEDDSTIMRNWNIGNLFQQRTGERGFQKIFIDEVQGANGTHRCLAMHFKLGPAIKKPSERKRFPIALIRNDERRDLSGYTGIEFYLWANRNLVITFGLADVQDDTSKEERWNRIVPVTTEITKIRISLDSLSLVKRRAFRLSTNQVLDINKIVAVHWVAHGKDIPDGTEAIIYLDEISFY